MKQMLKHWQSLHQTEAVSYNHDNSKKFETSSTGITITGDANWNDNGKAEFGKRC